MRNQYLTSVGWWCIALWIAVMGFSAWGQSAPPSQIQWQQVIEGGDITPATRVRAAKAGNGDYAILAGKNLVRLSLTGEVVWNKPVPGSYQDSSINRIPVRQTLALTPAKDGGFVILALDDQNRYYATQMDAAGKEVWAKTIDRANTGAARLTDDALAAAPDGSFLVAGTYTDQLSYLTLTKLSREGHEVGRWRIKISDSPQATLSIRQVLTRSDIGYLLVGSLGSKGIALQIDAKYNIVRQNTYPSLAVINDVVMNSQADNTYTALGSGAGGNGQVITLSPNGADDDNGLTLPSGANSSVAIAGDGTGSVTVLDAIGSNNGDFRLTNVTLPSAVRWTKRLGGSGLDVPTALLSTDDGGYLTVGTTTSTDGDVTGKTGTVASTWVVKMGTASQATTLRLQTPIYDCASGFIIFTTDGGDGSPITYNAPGVVQTKPTDNFGAVQPGLRNDPKVIWIQATQSGQTVTYAFDFGAYCRSLQQANSAASVATLQLIPPTYNCETGAITFRTTGGDGSPVEYMAAGITNGWTTNPNQFVNAQTRTAYDAQPLVLMARQNGQVVAYVFNVKAVCGRARIAATESGDALGVTVLGNPVHDGATVEITGAEGQSLLLRLFDARGRLVEQRTVGQARTTERQTFDLRQQPAGTLLLRATANGQSQTVKVLKH